ncbi:hypothetical protein FJ250_09425 [bacterium]|nr:hypothetical protein [bacterium]
MHRSQTVRALTALFLAAAVAAWSAPAAAAGFAVLMSHAWEGLYTGARLSAMGGSDLAGDDGPGALLVNPAPALRGDAVVVAHDHVDYPLGRVTGAPDPDIDYVTTSLGVEWQGWRLGTCVSDESADDVALRTAYAPEGSGTFDHRSRVALVSLARRLAGDTLREDGGQWIAGVAYRSYSARTSDNRTDPVVTFDDGRATGTWDVGTTAVYRFAGPTHRGSIAAAVAWQNVTAARRVIGEREMELPQVIREGVTAGLTILDGQREWVRVVAAVARSEYTSAGTGKHYSHMGLEVTALGLLAVRIGSNDRFYGGSGAWGVGLVLDHPRGLPLEMAVDYGEVSRDTLPSGGVDMAMWSGRVRVEY